MHSSDWFSISACYQPLKCPLADAESSHYWLCLLYWLISLLWHDIRLLILPLNSSSSSAGLKESPQMPLADSILLTEIMDEIRKQIGVVFSQDSQWHHYIAGLLHLTLNLLRWSRRSCTGQALDLWCKQITRGTVWQSLSRHSIKEATCKLLEHVSLHLRLFVFHALVVAS